MHPGMVQDRLDKASGYGAEAELKPTKYHREARRSRFARQRFEAALFLMKVIKISTDTCCRNS
jgi:hypothetical protein